MPRLFIVNYVVKYGAKAMTKHVYEKIKTETYHVYEKHDCERCGGDGRRRPVIRKKRDHTSSNMTSSLLVEFGEPTDEKCKLCGGKGYRIVDAYTADFGPRYAPTWSSEEAVLKAFPNAEPL